ncbi:MAG TPA: LLM class flavin-dependent oxidoreductase [Ktedonobacteraceae bacterium]|nr:LLM class flavin-dependent oxidoreductase [Ktedonobacteraceae bacterium]
MPTDYHQIGLPFEEAGARISRFEEAVRLIKYCLTQETSSFSGTYYPATDLDNRPLPLQQPYLPLYIGGGGKRMLQFAAREADIVGIGPKHGPGGMQMSEMTLESTAQKVAWVREAAGERFAHLELNCALLYVRITDQPSDEPSVASRWGVQIPQQSIYAAIGSVSQIEEELQARREQYGISYIQVTEPYMEIFASVVAHWTLTRRSDRIQISIVWRRPEIRPVVVR